jgi:hypothetical protein
MNLIKKKSLEDGYMNKCKSRLLNKLYYSNNIEIFKEKKI